MLLYAMNWLIANDIITDATIQSHTDSSYHFMFITLMSINLHSVLLNYFIIFLHKINILPTHCRYRVYRIYITFKSAENGAK